ncbi:arrestin domain-containing protein 3-like [Chironomus tepperi]|uniref:arrestin domain-containing protein 3-like n=1 Tax=Chironomus tepperi TaxID=113505 RepID=UPI00391F2409
MRKRGRTRTYEGTEIYLNTTDHIFGQEDGPELELLAGIHKYEFACQLPQHLPYSVSLKYAEISYYVEVLLDTSWKFDQEIKIPIHIIPHEDLNLYKNLKVSQTFEITQCTCSILCIPGSLMMTAHLPRTGFAVGHDVIIDIDYINKSHINVTATKVTLYRKIQYISQKPSRKIKTEKQVVLEASSVGVKAGITHSFGMSFKIPTDMLCSNKEHCKSACISYIMRIEAVFSSYYPNPEVRLPVVIGTVPIKDENSFSQTITSFIHPSVPMNEEEIDQSLPRCDEALKAPEKQSLTLMQEPINVH